MIPDKLREIHRIIPAEILISQTKPLSVDCHYCENTGRQPTSLTLINHGNAFKMQYGDELCPVCKGMARIFVENQRPDDMYTPCRFCLGFGRDYQPLEQPNEYSVETCRLCEGVGIIFLSGRKVRISPNDPPAYTGETMRLG